MIYLLMVAAVFVCRLVFVFQSRVIKQTKVYECLFCQVKLNQSDADVSHLYCQAISANTHTNTHLQVISTEKRAYQR